MPVPTEPRTRFDIGERRLTRVVASEMPLLDSAEIYPDSTPEDIEADLDWHVPHFFDPASGLLAITIQGFIVRAEDVDTVICTHRIMVVPTHFPSSSAGTIERDGRAFRFCAIA